MWKFDHIFFIVFIFFNNDVFLPVNAFPKIKVRVLHRLCVLVVELFKNSVLLVRKRSVDVLPHLSVIVVDFVRVAVFRRHAFVHVDVLLVQALLLPLVGLLSRPDLDALRPFSSLRRSRRQSVTASILRRNRPAFGLTRVVFHDLDHVLVDELSASHACASEVTLRRQSRVVVHAEPKLPCAWIEVVKQQVLCVSVVRRQFFLLHCLLVDLDLDLLTEKSVVLLRPRSCQFVVLFFDDSGLGSKSVRVRLICCLRRRRGFRAGTCLPRRACCLSFTLGSGRRALFWASEAVCLLRWCWWTFAECQCMRIRQLRSYKLSLNAAHVKTQL